MLELKNRNVSDAGTAKGQITLTAQESKVIELLRHLDYGEVRIVVKASEIVQIEEKKSVKL